MGDGIQIAPDGGFRGRGAIGLETGDPNMAGDVLANVLTAAIGIMTVIAVIWFVFLLLTGAIGVMTAGGDKAAIQGARSRISNGLLGLVIVFSAISIILVIGYVFNIPDIINIPVLISNIAGPAQ